jgi:preprotein translocase subunit SecG
MLNTIFSWDTLWVVLMIMYVPACLGLIVIVLLQKGKGTGFAGAFGMGAGGADTVFGPKSSQSLPVKLTYIAAATFMIIALVMSIVAGRVGKGQAPELLEVMEGDLAAVSGLDDLGIGRSVAGIDTSDAEDQADGTAAPDSDAEISDATDLDDLSTDDEAAGTEEQSDSADLPDAP